MPSQTVRPSRTRSSNAYVDGSVLNSHRLTRISLILASRASRSSAGELAEASRFVPADSLVDEIGRELAVGLAPPCAVLVLRPLHELDRAPHLRLGVSRVDVRERQEGRCERHARPDAARVLAPAELPDRARERSSAR